MFSLLHFAFLAVAVATSLREALTKRSDLTSFTDLLDYFQAWQPFEEAPANITVMAPNDAAYDKLLKMGLNLKDWPTDFTVPILRYHLLKGQIESAAISDESDPVLVPTDLQQSNMTQPAPVKLFRQEGKLLAQSGLHLTATVVDPDIEFAGGVVHVLDSSLVAPHNISATAWMSGLCKEFLGFMQETDLVSEIESLHDATLFIPSDEAWQRAHSKLATMSLNEKRMLLRNHAVRNQVAYRENLSQSPILSTEGGRMLRVTMSDQGQVLVEKATLLQTDIFWTNGVAHMIDEVIMAEQTIEKGTHQEREREL